MTISILCMNKKIQTDVKYLGFRGVLPEDVAQAIRDRAAPKPSRFTPTEAMKISTEIAERIVY